jgi:hypothetical protein
VVGLNKRIWEDMMMKMVGRGQQELLEHRSMAGSCSPVLVLVQWNTSKASKTFFEYSSLEEALLGILSIYIRHRNPKKFISFFYSPVMARNMFLV